MAALDDGAREWPASATMLVAERVLPGGPEADVRIGAAPPLLVEAMSGRQRLVYRVLAGVWMLALYAFWTWWLDPSHVTSPTVFLLATGVIAYLLFVPGYFVLLVGRMQRPNPRLPVPADLRVALATSFVPASESIEVLERTLVAMTRQQGAAADVWVLDEGDVPEVRALAARLGVHYFTRHGIARYQAGDWPFKARYKAGNYNAWLDAVGYERYDVLVQMDTDHVPSPTYLAEVLRPLSDPRVAYVAAPSDVSGNLEQSWVVTARIGLDAPLHGPMQLGFNRRLCPIIIGSHSAMRTQALRTIGGFQRTRAEDHHNTLRFAHAGLRGVYAPTALAVGDGPPSFDAAVSQEYQWARSITLVLARFFRRDARGLPLRMWLEFLFCETWYTLYSGMLGLGFFLPLLALLTNHPWAHISYVEFIVRFELVELAVLALVLWTRTQGWMRPRHTPIVTWQAMLYSLARWPVVLLAVGDGLISAAIRRDFRFGVTAKSSQFIPPLSWRTIALFSGLSLVFTLEVIRYVTAGSDERDAAGYVWLALVSGSLYALLTAAIVLLHRRDVRRTHPRARVRGLWAKLVYAGAVTAVLVLAWAAAAPALVGAVLWTRSGVAAGAAGSSSATTVPVLGPYTYPPLIAQPTEPFLGAYDPDAHLTAAPGLAAQEFFLDWNQNVAGQIETDVRASQSLKRFPMLTIEPWTPRSRPADAVLLDIAGGVYARTEARIASALKAVAPQQVYLRFAADMDLTRSPFPWARGGPAEYVAAYRQFVGALRQAGVANARYVWSPSQLTTGTLAYYPGGDVVDLVGTTILVRSLPGATVTRLHAAFAQALAPQLTLASQLDKPLVVAEAGEVFSSTALGRPWLAGMLDSLRHTPGLVGVVIFDAHTADVWAGFDYTNYTLSQQDGAFVTDGARHTPD